VPTGSVLDCLVTLLGADRVPRQRHSCQRGWRWIVLLHFLELGTKLEMLGFGCNTDLTEDQVDVLLTQARQASKSLVSFIHLLVARDSPNGVREE
jgi:hypothetical protein